MSRREASAGQGNVTAVRRSGFRKALAAAQDVGRAFSRYQRGLLGRRIQCDFVHLDKVVRIKAPSVDRIAIRGNEGCDVEIPTGWHDYALVREECIEEKSSPLVYPDEGARLWAFAGETDYFLAVVADI